MRSGLLSPMRDSGFYRSAILGDDFAPEGNDNARSRLLSPSRVLGILGMSISENYVALAGKAVRVQGFCPQSKLQDL